MEDIVRSVTRANLPLSGSEYSLNGGSLEEDESFSFHHGWMNNRNFIKQLQKDNIDLTLFRSELGHHTRHRRSKTCREKILHYLRSNVVQIFLSLLVLLDACIVICEIILEIHWLKSLKKSFENQLLDAIDFLNATFVDQLSNLDLAGHGNSITDMTRILKALHGVSCSTGGSATSYPSAPHRVHRRAADVALTASRNSEELNSTSSSLLATMMAALKRSNTPSQALTLTIMGGDSPELYSSSHSTSVLMTDNHSSGNPTADKLHTISEFLHYTSIGILGFFVVVVSLKIFCIGMQFFKEKFEVVDAVIIITSFAADIVFVNLASTEITVMVIFLLWRIVRVINGLMMHEKQRDEFRITLQKKARRVSEMKVEHLSTQAEMQKKHIVALEELSKELGSSEDQLKKCRPRLMKSSKQQTNNALKSIAALTTGFMGGLVGAQPSNKNPINKFTGSSPPPTTSSTTPPLSTVLSTSQNYIAGASCSSPLPSTCARHKVLSAITQTTPDGSFEYTDLEPDPDSPVPHPVTTDRLLSKVTEHQLPSTPPIIPMDKSRTPRRPNLAGCHATLSFSKHPSPWSRGLDGPMVTSQGEPRLSNGYSYWSDDEEEDANSLETNTPGNNNTDAQQPPWKQRILESAQL